MEPKHLNIDNNWNRAFDGCTTAFKTGFKDGFDLFVTVAAWIFAPYDIGANPLGV